MMIGSTWVSTDELAMAGAIVFVIGAALFATMRKRD